MPNIKEFRNKLVLLKEVEEIELVLQEVIQKYHGFQFELRKPDMDALAYSCDS
ncbi:MAG: hypothetical protein ACO29O_04020 [Chitinophagaceae bacterium]